jgi:putative hydrolase of the HAD superfamily
LSLPYACKDSLLWSYRLHVPNINLSPDIKLLLEKIKSAKIKTSIITDGRSLTQRLKINKLKLENIPFFISEEYGSEKPNPYRFNLIMKKWPNKNYVYVADNPLKDFQAPMELGWFCIGADWFNNKIYKNFSTMKTIQPHIWLDNPMLLFSVLEDKSCYQTNL